MDAKETSVKAVYACFRNNDELLLQSASGGIAAALSEEALRQGGYVAGVAYTEDWHDAEYIITNKESKIDRLKGSKYFDVKRDGIYQETKLLLDKGHFVLFTGLPCTVAALNNFLKQDYPNLLTCELICHGTTKARVHKEYVERLEKRFRSPLTFFSVRYKKGTWTPPYLRAEFKNGRIFEKRFYETEYGYAFSVLANKQCYRCPFKGENSRADLTIGDFWGVKNGDPFWNPKGVSVVIVHTERGHEFLKGVKGIELFETSYERAVEKNPRIISPRPVVKNRDRFEALFEVGGLFYAMKNIRSTKERIRAGIKSAIPESMRRLLKI